jgi:hypothetical protein
MQNPDVKKTMNNISMEQGDYLFRVRTSERVKG